MCVFVCVYMCMCMCRGKRALRVHVYDILRTLVIVISYVVLSQVQLSRVYHYIRGEAIIKLYVFFNILEVCVCVCAFLCVCV